MKRKVLVYGWYGKHNLNLGDNLFKKAFGKLFPKYTFVFKDHITPELLLDVDNVIFGGGSFLEATPKIHINALSILKTKNIFYIGVGVEGHIDPIHIDLLTIAKAIYTRTYSKVEYLQSINANSFYLPDLIYSIMPQLPMNKNITKSILIIPNISVVPTNIHQHWIHTSWEYFKSEFSQFLTHMIDDKYNINFFSMCQSNTSHDRWAATEIMNKLSYKKESMILPDSQDITSVLSLINSYDLVISQRYHGAILSELANVNCITIGHHDKFISNANYISYYEASKQALMCMTKSILANKEKKAIKVDIKEHLFEECKNNIQSIISGNKWIDTPG